MLLMNLSLKKNESRQNVNSGIVGSPTREVRASGLTVLYSTYSPTWLHQPHKIVKTRTPPPIVTEGRLMIDGVVQNPNTNRRQSEPKKDTLSLKSHRPQIPLSQSQR